MKNIFLIAAVLTLCSFTAIEYLVKNNTAEVDQLQGIYIFNDCKPVKEYEYLGTVKINWSWSGKYDALRDKMIKKSKIDYPAAQAIIITNTNTDGTPKCDAVKFK